MFTTARLSTILRSSFDKEQKHNTQGAEEPFCNTLQHERHEIEAVLPPNNTRSHITPEGWEPHLHHGLWLPLIARSQRIPSEAIHTIILPPKFLIFLDVASGAARITGTINLSNHEDLLETFPTHTASGTPISSLFTPCGELKWFARLDTSSLKDYFRPGASAEPTTSVQQLCEHLSLSPRAYAGIENMRRTSSHGSLYLVPWREDLRDAVELRVFCPPTCWSSSPSDSPPQALYRALPLPATLPRISAISQYQSGPPWRQLSRLSLVDEAQAIVHGCQAILQDIITRAGELNQAFVGGSTALEELCRMGFSFDVFVLAGSGIAGSGMEVQLVELNCFGAMSGCGSCLFHWIRDARVLYGVEDGVVEFRVTVEDSI